MPETFYLPSKLISHLRRIDIEYERNDDRKKHEIVTTARTFVDESVSIDNWNGGTYGHDIYFYMPLEFFREISISEQRNIADSIKSDLNEYADKIQNEFWNEIHLEIIDELDIHYQRSNPPLKKSTVNPEKLTIWEPGAIRLFISHRDIHKKKAFQLAESLMTGGISSFVAHDTIEATKEWRQEIMNGLESMDIMLVFLTNDFVDSPYTNQEVGFALGRGIPIISLKLENKDPPGFISHVQAEKGHYDDPCASSNKIQRLVYKMLGREAAMRASIIRAFSISPNFTETRDRFENLKEFVKNLTPKEVSQLTLAFSENSQLHNAGYLTNSSRFLDYLKKETGSTFVREGRVIKRASPSRTLDEDDPLPF